MARGLIEGALGGLAGAAGEIATGHIKNEQELDLRKELSAVEEQRQMRIMEAQETQRRAGRQADFEQGLANAPRATQVKIDEAKALNPVQTELEVDRTKKVGAAKGETERAQATALGQDKGALAGIRAEAQAKDMGGPERALRAQEINLRLEELRASTAEKKDIRDQLQQAAEARASGNEDAAQQIEAAVRTQLGLGAKGGEKSFADVASLTRSWLTTAKDLEKEAELAKPEEAAQLKEEARTYRQRASDLSASVAQKRGVGGGGAPAKVAGSPYPEGTQLTGPDGQRYVVRDGKPVPTAGGRKASGTVTQE